MKTKCSFCGFDHDVPIEIEDYFRWVEGELLQNAAPYLSVNDREMLISKTCSTCYDELFPEEDE